MKKVAVRFNHPSFSDELLSNLGITNTVIKHPRKSETFDVLVDNMMQFDPFADKIEKATGNRPDWVAVFSIDIKKETHQAA